MRVLSLVKLIRLAKDLNSGEDNSFLLGAITGRIFMMCDLGLMSDKDSESLANYVDSFIDIDDADVFLVAKDSLIKIFNEFIKDGNSPALQELHK